MVDNLTSQILTSWLGWAAWIIVGFGIYYLWRGITFGAVSAIKGTGGPIDRYRKMRKGIRKTIRKAKRAQKSEYRIIDDIKDSFEKLEKEAQQPHPSVKPVEKALENAAKQVDRAVEWDYLIDDLKDQIKKVSDDTKKNDLGNDLDILTKAIKPQLEYIKKALEAQNIPKSIKEGDWTKVKKITKACISNAKKIERKLAAMQILENRIEQAVS